jgi:hypothetical protein
MAKKAVRKAKVNAKTRTKVVGRKASSTRKAVKAKKSASQPNARAKAKTAVTSSKTTAARKGITSGAKTSLRTPSARPSAKKAASRKKLSGTATTRKTASKPASKPSKSATPQKKAPAKSPAKSRSSASQIRLRRKTTASRQKSATQGPDTSRNTVSNVPPLDPAATVPISVEHPVSEPTGEEQSRQPNDVEGVPDPVPRSEPDA